MWKLYTSHGESICVRTTFKILAEELPSECMIGCVRYIDYDKSVIDMSNGLNYVMHKRDTFQHEREVRSVIQRRSRLSEQNLRVDKWNICRG